MGRGEMGSVGRSVGQLDWIGLDWTGLGFASQAVGGRVGSRGAGQLGSNNDDGVALGACVAAQCRQAGRPVPTPECVQQVRYGMPRFQRWLAWWVQPQSGRMSSSVYQGGGYFRWPGG